jgi:GNAT superfamily N-acetyltransferase
MIDVVRLQGSEAMALGAMTFPVYRHLLALEPAPRHPEQGDPKPVQPCALVAIGDGEPLGLLLAELPLVGDEPAEVLSVFVRPEHRRQGVATALLAGAGREVAAAGFRRLDAVYTADRPNSAAIEGLLARGGWASPKARTVTVRFAPERFLTSELFNERRLAALDPGLEIVPWATFSETEKAALRELNERQPWITPQLEFWRFDFAGFDAATSVGARYKGRVVGWVITHRVSPEIVRYTCSFMHKGLSRRGRIVPLYHRSLRLAVGSCRLCTSVTPVIYPNMLRFIDRWMKPIAELVAETRGSQLRLIPPAAGPG